MPETAPLDTTAPTAPRVVILVLANGWVLAGRRAGTADDPATVVLEDAAVVRRWGTTKGLGEIVVGPTSKTVLDPCGTVRVPARAILFELACDGAAWSPRL